MTDITAASNSFTVSSLALKETHLLRLNLDDTLPALGPTPQFHFKVTSNLLFNQRQPELLRVDLQIDATAKATGGSKAMPKARARLAVAVIFEYEGLQTLKNSGKLPVDLGLTAVSIAYSTVRGIFQTRLAGTSFDKALLPIVSPQQLWKPPTAPGTALAESAE